MLRGKRLIDYPRRGRTGVFRWLPSWKLVASLVVSFVLVTCGGAMAVYAAIPVPEIKASVGQQHLTVLDRNGKILGIRGPEIRQDVPLTRVPAQVQNAVLAAEDRNFWTDPAISVTGTARAAINDLSGGSTQGGSTITQQYVKNAYLNDEQTLTRKVKEAVISLKISQEQSKAEILQGYLNTVYFGRSASGIQMAARAYFGKNVDQLTVAEGAVLAAAVNAPSYYETAGKDPQAMAKLQARWNYVLDGMVAMGKLTQAERDAQKFPALAAWPAAGSTTDAQYPYLVEAAISEAEQKLGVDRETLVTGGYTIKTTFDAAMQDDAAAAVQKQITANLDPAKHSVDQYVQASIATVVPGDGAVRVLYGGDDYSKQAFNASWQGTLSPGSTFKAFVLAAYLQNGGSVDDTFDGDSPYQVPGSSATIPNEGGESYGNVSVRYATQQSINTVYVQMAQKAGLDNVIKAAHAAGIPATTDIPAVPTLPLGVISTNPMQMAGAYATFADHGAQYTPYTVSSITQGTDVVYQHTAAPTRAFSPAIADGVGATLQSVVTNGSGRAAQLADGRDVAGKTGTTDLPGNGGDRASAWFVGYTNELSTAVAIYGQKPDGSLVSVNGLMGQRLGGGAVAAPLWSAYMNKAVAGTPATYFHLTPAVTQPQQAPTVPSNNGDANGGGTQQQQPVAPQPTDNWNYGYNGQNQGQSSGSSGSNGAVTAPTTSSTRGRHTNGLGTTQVPRSTSTSGGTTTGGSTGSGSDPLNAGAAGAAGATGTTAGNAATGADTSGTTTGVTAGAGAPTG